MDHSIRLYLVPLVAIVLGLLLFATSKDKWSTIGGYIFLAGFVIFLWFLTIGGVR